MLTIKEIKECKTAFRFWTNNYLAGTVDNILGSYIVERTVEGKNKIVYVVKAGQTNGMIEHLYRTFAPLQKRIEIL